MTIATDIQTARTELARLEAAYRGSHNDREAIAKALDAADNAQDESACAVAMRDAVERIHDRQFYGPKLRPEIATLVDRYVGPPRVGDVATFTVWTDAHVVDIVAVSKSGKTVTTRERKAIMVKKPTMVPGGFSAVCTERAEYRTEPNPNGCVRKATRRQDGRYRFAGHKANDHRGTLRLGVDAYHYDHNF